MNILVDAKANYKTYVARRLSNYTFFYGLLMLACQLARYWARLGKWGGCDGVAMKHATDFYTEQLRLRKKHSQPNSANPRTRLCLCYEV